MITKASEPNSERLREGDLKSSALSLVTQLTDPVVFTPRPTRVEVRETHISWVFLTEQFAYKLKKPVRFDFLDFSTQEKRHQACLAEVQLNRRLAPDVYLGVVPIVARKNGIQVEGEGQPLDWMVKMKRLPDDRRLATLLAEDKLTDANSSALARRLAEFYAQMPPVSINTDEYLRRFVGNVIGNGDELLRAAHRLDPQVVSRIVANQLRFLTIRDDVVGARACDGRIIDGHGDLRPDHIYFLPAPTIIDCIEFNHELRELDILDDVAFLAVECSLQGNDELAGRILAEYCQRSGDTPPSELLAFYMSYRATVRSKVEALRAEQAGENDRSAHEERCSAYLHLADHYAAKACPPMLLIVRGVSGSGKTTLARELAELLHMRCLHSDDVRKELSGGNNGATEYGAGQYAPQKREAVYENMLDRANGWLERNESVILDGTFLSSKQRSKAALVARHNDARPLVIECCCPDHIAVARIEERQQKGQASSSDARSEFVALQRSEEQPNPSGLAICHVDTSIDVSTALDQILRALKRIA